MQTRPLLIALSATLFCVPMGMTQEPPQDDADARFFADFGYSRLGPDLIEFTDTDISLEYGAVNGHVGYRFSDHWSVEGEAMLGIENDKINFSNVYGTTSVRGRNKYDFDGLIGVHLRGDLPVTSKLNAFARAGIVTAHIDIHSDALITDLDTEEVTSSSSRFTQDDTGIALGIGLTYDITDKVYLRSDYSRYDLENAEMDSVGLGLGFRF